MWVKGTVVVMVISVRLVLVCVPRVVMVFFCVYIFLMVVIVRLLVMVFTSFV